LGIKRVSLVSILTVSAIVIIITPLFQGLFILTQNYENEFSGNFYESN